MTYETWAVKQNIRLMCFDYRAGLGDLPNNFQKNIS